jgi:hypothetical protein
MPRRSVATQRGGGPVLPLNELRLGKPHERMQRRSQAKAETPLDEDNQRAETTMGEHRISCENCDLLAQVVLVPSHSWDSYSGIPIASEKAWLATSASSTF